MEPDSDDHDYKPHGIVSRQNVTPPNETTARRSQRFLVKQEIKTEDECDDVDVKTSKRVTPQKSNSESKLNGTQSADGAASGKKIRTKETKVLIKNKSFFYFSNRITSFANLWRWTENAWY